MILCLQTNFGRITDQKLSDKEDEFKTCSYDLSTPVNSVFNRIKAFQDLCVLTINSENLPSTQQANNISDTTVTNAQLLTFLKTLQNKVDRLETNTPSPTISTNSTINPRTGKEFKRYCFPVAVAYIGEIIVPPKKSGHKDDATFKNRMGGSNENCMPNRT